jgi:hypothetical protein
MGASKLVSYTRFSSNDNIQKNERVRACSTHGKEINGYKVSMGQLGGRRPQGRISRGLEGSIEADLQIKWDGEDWIKATRHRDQ